MYLASDALVSPVTMEPSAPHSAAASASCPSPRTPPTSANRRLVRPLLLQRKNTIQQVSQGKASGQGGQVSGRPLAVSARYPDEVVPLDASQAVARGASSALATPNERDGITAPTDVSTTAATREDSRTSKGGAAAETAANSSPTIANPSSVNVSEGEAPAVHCPPLCSSHAATPFLRATQPPIKRISAARPRPLLLPRTDTPMSLASYPSNLSSGARANSSADSSFAGISSVSKPGGPVDGAVTTAKPSTPSTHLSGRQTNEIAGERHAVPPLLRSSFSTNTLQDDANPSSASSYAARAPMNGSPSPRLRVGGPVPPYLPSSATSVTSGAATPLSSTRSSGRPSFLRTILPSPLVASAPAPTAAAASSGGGTTSAHEAHTLTTKDVAPRAVNGRVLSSPHGARRPELGPRRTTFGRTASVASLTDGTASTAAAAPPPAADVVVAGAGERGSGGDGVQVTAIGDGSSAAAAAAAAEPAMSREMRSFVLGQYRTLQREVRTLPTVAEKSGPPAQVDVSAADFVHVKRCTCPRHSKAARRAEIKRQEEERLRAVQQQHHDMAVIRNGGREQVGTNMKSSTMLAGSLSKLRSRNKGSGQSGSADRIRSSLDRTISLAFESEESPFGSPEEVETTKLYGVSPFPSSTLDGRASPAHQQQHQGESEPPAVSAQAAGTEAWHASRFFMAVPAASQERRSSRTVNKNGMKGEAIVVAVVPDSDEDDEESSASEAETGRGGRLRRTKGVASGTRAASRQTAVPPAEVREVATSAAVVAGATKRSGADNNSNNNNNSSSSDDDACFSFNKLRTQRLRSSMTQSLSFSQTLDQKSLSTMLPLAAPQSTAQSPERAMHRPGKMLSPSKVSSSSSSSDAEDDEDVDPDACCVCCPCKKPENFFALCRTGSRSNSFVTPEPELREPRQDGGSSPLYDPRAEKAAPHVRSAAAASTAVPLRASADVKAGFDSRVELEDLETMHDDDEPLLSMQSFRRTSIQRVR